MSGYMIMLAGCVACSAPISCNPDFCPSIRVNGQREPICRACFDKWNQIHRIDKGLDPIALHPEAYAPTETL